MENETEKILEEQVLKLPREVTRFLSSSSWTDTLEKISVSQKLTTEETAQFKNETVLVLAGLVHPDAYPETLGAVLGVNPTLTAVVAAVEQEIFAPVRPALVKFFDEERAHSGEEDTTEKQSIPEIPSPWAISTEQIEAEKLTPVTPPTPVSPPAPIAPVKITPPPTPKKESVPPPNLPTEEELVWTPRVLENVPPAQPLPQTFSPLGKKTPADTDKEFMHPFEKNMQAAGMTRTTPKETSGEGMPAVPRYGTPEPQVAQPISTPPSAPTPPPPARTTLSIPIAPKSPFAGVVAPTPANAGGDPYREPIE
ncbi:MAG: hypothetical protein AAB552_02595 [Patescibacteria group bacterium]